MKLLKGSLKTINDMVLVFYRVELSSLKLHTTTGSRMGPTARRLVQITNKMAIIEMINFMEE